MKIGTFQLRKPQAHKDYSLINSFSVICLKQSEVGIARICFMANHLQVQTSSDQNRY